MILPVDVMGGDDSTSSFRPEGGRVVVDGLDLAAFKKIITKRFSATDFKGVSFAGMFIEKFNFLDCVFLKCNLTAACDIGNKFIRCSFVNCNFKNANIGYGGSGYFDCMIKDCRFSRTAFVRPEYTRCVFSGKFVGVDFSAASFEHCKFIGYFNEVWFRGGFMHPEFENDFGKPKKNTMKQADFSRAEVALPIFSDGVLLDSVILPADESLVRFDRWPEVLQMAKKTSAEYFSNNPSVRAAAETYVKVHEAHAIGQEWYIENFQVGRSRIT
jgi:hypothetical protein